MNADHLSNLTDDALTDIEQRSSSFIESARANTQEAIDELQDALSRSENDDAALDGEVLAKAIALLTRAAGLNAEFSEIAAAIAEVRKTR